MLTYAGREATPQPFITFLQVRIGRYEIGKVAQTWQTIRLLVRDIQTLPDSDAGRSFRGKVANDGPLSERVQKELDGMLADTDPPSDCDLTIDEGRRLDPNRILRYSNHFHEVIDGDGDNRHRVTIPHNRLCWYMFRNPIDRHGSYPGDAERFSLILRRLGETLNEALQKEGEPDVDIEMW